MLKIQTNRKCQKGGCQWNRIRNKGAILDKNLAWWSERNPDWAALLGLFNWCINTDTVKILQAQVEKPGLPHRLSNGEWRSIPGEETKWEKRWREANKGGSPAS